MSDLLRIYEAPDRPGLYLVETQGATFELTTPPQFDMERDYVYSRGPSWVPERHYLRPNYTVSFDMVEYTPPPKPEPRKWSRSMGLRKPKGTS
ncbi:hypothetical protein SEA_PHILLIS_35 [Mycobacterium phage Phillis]|nr:hypothetical protein SEA_PHILLIS_35 [Mycobacterium phage Phillis]